MLSRVRRQLEHDDEARGCVGPALARLPQRGADAQVPQEARGGRTQEGTDEQQPGNCFHKIMDQS